MRLARALELIPNIVSTPNNLSSFKNKGALDAIFALKILSYYAKTLD